MMINHSQGRDGMSYCPKCGNKVDETMVFCPQCGTSLKGAAPSQTPPTPLSQRNEKNAKHEKTEHGFIGYLMGGLILITIGVFAILDLTYSSLTSGQDVAIMLFIIGIIIIIGAVYVALTSRRHVPAIKPDKPA
jgi:predicted lipid-binding transport protein (Tim44 family)